MNKEFEAIRDDKLRIGLLALKRLVEANKEKISKDEIMAFDFTFMNITKALLELQEIKEAKPSIALNYLCNFINEMTYCLEHPKEYAKGYEKEIFYKYKYTLETTIKQALINKSKKEQGFDILISMLTGGFEFEEDREALVYSIAKACEETFGEDSKELILIKELLNIDENKYIDFCKEYSKND